MRSSTHTLIIVRGPAGVGKSSITEQLRKDLGDGWACLDIDRLKHMISSESTPVRAQISHEVALFFVQKLMDQNFGIIAEEIFHAEFLEQMRELAMRRDYQVFTIFLTAPVEALIERDQARTEKTKGEETIRRLHESIQPTGEDMVIDTSQTSVEEAVELISERTQYVR